VEELEKGTPDAVMAQTERKRRRRRRRIGMSFKLSFKETYKANSIVSGNIHKHRNTISLFLPRESEK
jgi:hypothetical protein